MPTFADLSASAPAIGGFLGDRIAKTGLCLLGTTRSDGWPRVSPIELSVIDDRLYVGSMPHAVKAQDLQRDARCCVITPLSDKDDLAGEGKAFCRAREVTSGDEWERVRSAWRDKTGFDIGDPGGAHVFELDIEAAAWQRLEGDDWRTSSWQAGGTVRERVRNGPIGESRDL
ncbi:MAG: pyridoxamine 5'-phosphate oxidase family protein [Acidimicrobiales bacterium]